MMQRETHESLPAWQRASSGQNFLSPSAPETTPTGALPPYRRNSRGGLRHQSRSLNHEVSHSPTSRSYTSHQPSPASNRIRHQPNFAMTVCESDAAPLTSTLKVLDDFDYFCSMGGAPSPSRNRYLSDCPPVVPAPQSTDAANTETKARRQWLRKLRSQSVLPPTGTEGTSFPPSSLGRNVQPPERGGRRIPPYGYVQRAHTQDYSLHPNDLEPPIGRQRSTEKPEVVLASGHSSAASLTKNNAVMPSYSPNRQPLTPLPPLPLCTESPLGAAISQDDLAADDPDLVEFKVQVVGSPGVGKTTICQCLTNLDKEDSNFGDDADDDVQHFSIRAMLNGNEFKVCFSETNLYDETDSMNVEIQDNVDAFLVVYAVDDGSTYEFARRVLLELCKSMANNSIPPAGFILAANKFDLVRRREVNSEDARQFAAAHNAKFIEISAALGHMIPELLLTVITHLCELDESKSGSRRGAVSQHHNTSTSSPSSPHKSTTARRDLASGSTNAASKSAAVVGAGGGANSCSPGGVAYASKTSSSNKGSLIKFLRRHFTKSSTTFDGIE